LSRRVNLILCGNNRDLNSSRKDDIMPNSSEIDARVTRVLVQALGVEEEDIKPSATLQGDLGAESIDFLDIVFRLEREFAIKIPHGELLSEQVFRGDTEIVQDGQVTDEGLAALRSQLPYADLKALEHDRRLNRISDLFTVDLLSSYITWKLGRRGGSGSDVHAPATITASRTLEYRSK
jgi:acyl carrier protein